MYALPGTLALIGFVLARPFDFISALKSLPFLHLFFAIALFGLLIDARRGWVTLPFKSRATPQLPLLGLLLAWCLVTAALAPGGQVGASLAGLGVVLALYLVIGEGVQSLAGLEAVAAMVLACSLWIAAVCVQQAAQPFTCVAFEQKDDLSAQGVPDGRPCSFADTCYEEPPEPQALYRCERAGLLGITTVDGGRVRYLGVLHDPNEVALAVSLSLPLAVGFAQVRRTWRRRLLCAIAALLTFATVVLSQSRGGLIVLVTICGVYFLRRHGWRGALLGAIAALPAILLGGRHTARAASSTDERLETWYEGLDMVRSHPLIGVGHDQFLRHHFLTAHNSFLLAAAENGLPGLLLWTAALYAAVKIPWEVLRSARGSHAERARIWALALLASLCGLSTGMLFLTFNYHYVTWIYLGLSGALWHAVRRQQPDFAVRLAWRDALAVLGASVAVLAGIYVSSRGH